MDEPISEEAFRAFHLKFSRGLARLMLFAIEEGGSELSVIDKRLGKRRGHTQRVLSQLADGKQMKIDPIGSVLWAAGGYILDFSGSSIGLRRPLPPSPTSEE